MSLSLLRATFDLQFARRFFLRSLTRLLELVRHFLLKKMLPSSDACLALRRKVLGQSLE